MKRILLSVSVLVATSCLGQVAEDATSHVAVLSSAEVQDRAEDRPRVARALSYIVSELQVPRENMPNVVVVYASPDAASVDGLPEEAKVTVAKVTFAGSPLYQVWVTGRDFETLTVQGLIWTVNRHFGLGLNETAIDKVRLRVLRHMSETVSVNALRHH